VTRIAVNAVLLGLGVGLACFFALWVVIDVGLAVRG